MLTNAVVRLISEVVGASMVYIDEPMSRHTTFRIGGKADVLVKPSSMSQVETVIRMLRQMKVPCCVLGNGSNVLVGDGGIRGVVVKLEKDFSACEVGSVTIRAEAGMKLSRLANLALSNSLAGLEFASGIPGTLGGAVYMNAGAYGGEMKNLIQEVTYLDEAGRRQTALASACEFGYRTSLFSQNPGYVILDCTLRLEPGNKEEIRAKMDEFTARRTQKQPLNLPSAGSAFKRPEGHYAGSLIEEAGLKGFRVGGASVSEKHAGFIVNDQNATAADVRELIRQVQEKVKKKFGVELQPEVRLIGQF